MSSFLNSRIQVAIAGLLALQALTVITVWTLDTVGAKSQEVFGLFVAVNLVSFSMISYMYRLDKRKDIPNRILLAAGIFFALLLLLIAFFFW